MFYKAQLFVIVVVLFSFGCKDTGIDYRALDNDGDRPSNPWAMADLFLIEPDDAEDAGEIVLVLSEHLAQDTSVRGVHMLFRANGTLNFAAPDSNNAATLRDNEVLIGKVNINLFNSVGDRVCPDNPIVADQLMRDREDGVIFHAMDLACAGNVRVAMNAIAHSIDKLADVASHAWLEDHKEVLEKTEKFYEEEKGKGEKGALHKTEDQSINDAIDNFLIARKRLKGYAVMHTELEKHQNLAAMKSAVKDAAKDSDMHVVIPATLNAFLDIRVNNHVIPNDTTGTGGDTDLMLLKGAIGSAAAKFLQYEKLFQLDVDFASDETRAKFTGIKDRLQDEVRTHVEAIEDNFAELKSEEDVVYTTANSVYNLLSARLTCMNRFLNEQKADGEACESVLGEFYNNLTSLSCGGTQVDDGDVFILLTTRKIMEATNIHDPCKDYVIKVDKFHQDYTSLINAGVADLKNSVIKSMEDMLKIYGKNDFRAKLLQSHFYAAVPVITAHPEKADELSAAISVAHDDIYNKRKTDVFWQGLFGWIYKAAAVVGIFSLAFWLFPPAGAVVTGLTSMLAAVAVGAGAFLAAGYGKDWFHERGDYAALEKAIYSGGQGDVAGLADTMMEWKEAKRLAIWEGIFVTVGVGGARRLITDPRGVRTAYTRANLGQKWKSWREARRAAKEAKQAAKAVAKTPEGIAAARKLKDETKAARVLYREAKHKLKNSPNNTELTEEMKDAGKLYKGLLAQSRQGIVARTKDAIASGFSAAHNKIRGIKNPSGGETADDVKKVKGFFASNIKKIKESRKQIYFLNKKAWKSSANIKNLNAMVKLAKNNGGNIHWKLNKDGTAVFKADQLGLDYITKKGKIDDFKLGADGFWIAVLGAERLDKFLGWLLGEERGRRFIEGRIEGVRSLPVIP